MYLELLAFFGLFLLILYVIAEGTRKPIVGAFASLLLITLGVWVIVDGLQMRTGDVLTKNEFQNQTVSFNNATNATTTALTTTGTDTTVYVYSPVPATPYLGLQFVLGIVLVLLGLYGATYYAMRFGEAE